jgi:hypothetical protein
MERKTFEKLIVDRLIKKFPTFYETLRCITVRFEVLKAAIMRITVLWNVTRYNLAPNY